MRTHGNHAKGDPSADSLKKLLRFTIILAVVVVLGVGVMFLCSSLIQNDYRGKVTAIQQENVTKQAQFEEQMTALRNANTVKQTLDDSGDKTEAALDRFTKTLLSVDWTVEDQGKIGLENYSTVTYDRLALINGGLLLVNPWHALPADFNADAVVSVGRTSGGAIQVTDYSVKLFPAAYDAVSKVIAAAKEEASLGDFIIRKGYRTNEEQTTLFETEMEKLSSKYSGDILVEQTKKNVNYPGTSEYQSGMSFEIDIYNKTDASVGKQKFSESKQGLWFVDNSWRFGMICRFPTGGFPNEDFEDKSYKTGVSSKMNLYRFVGTPHATAMRVMDMCLEEYIEYLIKHPHLCVYEGDKLRYEVFRLESEDLATYNLPKPNMASETIASFDNMNGIVMAYTYQ